MTNSCPTWAECPGDCPHQKERAVRGPRGRRRELGAAGLHRRHLQAQRRQSRRLHRRHAAGDPGRPSPEPDRRAHALALPEVVKPRSVGDRQSVYRLSAGGCGGGAAAADGARRRGGDRRGPLRARGWTAHLAQRLSGPRVQDPARRAEPAGAEAAPGLVLPRLPRAAPDLGEGGGGGDPGSLDRRRVDAPGRRPGTGHGAHRHLQEHGLEAVQGDRRAGARLPRTAAHRRLALPLARCHLPQGPPGREDRLGRRHNRRGGQHRRPPRDRRPRARSLGGGDLLDRVPARAEEPRPRRRQAGDLRRPHRPQGGDRPGLRGNLAAVPRALD